MPKENTHIHFAESLLKELDDSSPVGAIIREHLPEYYLGSIGPDILFYSNDEKVAMASESLHGADGSPTNELILDVLKSSPSLRDMAFIMGYLTHCVLDIVFHPVIYYLSGNYYDEDEDKKPQRPLHAPLPGDQAGSVYIFTDQGTGYHKAGHP